jgi:hypothetical protein
VYVPPNIARLPSVSWLPASACTVPEKGPVPFLVMMLTTPPMASAPWRVDCGPRMISMRSMRSGETSERSTRPRVGLFTRTPSMSTCTWLAFAPRMLIVESLPKPPERWIWAPGSLRSASSTVG